MIYHLNSTRYGATQWAFNQHAIWSLRNTCAALAVVSNAKLVYTMRAREVSGPLPSWLGHPSGCPIFLCLFFDTRDLCSEEHYAPRITHPHLPLTSFSVVG